MKAMENLPCHEPVAEPQADVKFEDHDQLRL